MEETTEEKKLINTMISSSPMTERLRRKYVQYTEITLNVVACKKRSHFQIEIRHSTMSSTAPLNLRQEPPILVVSNEM